VLSFSSRPLTLTLSLATPSFLVSHGVTRGKIEQTAFGGVAIQMVDIMYPGQVPIHKVNWGAKQSFEFVGNYKVLQSTMTKLKVERFVDVDKLIKGKYQDNLEFMQWLKRFFEMSVSEVPADYDAAAQRMRGKGGATYNKEFGGVGGVTTASTKSAPTGARTTSSRSAAPPRAPVQKENKTNPNPPAATSRATSSAGGVKKPSSAPSKPSSNTGHMPPSAAQSAALQARTEELEAARAAGESQARAVVELKQEMDGLEKERDFYFDKLRDIEMMLQDKEDTGLGTEMSASIFKILYATADGFEQTTEEAEVAKANLMDQEQQEPAVEAEVVAAVE